MRHLFLATAAAVVAFMPAACAQAEDATTAITAAIASPSRSDANRARDVYRHPAETLAFFDVKPGQTVIEFYPGGGWYTGILAPLLRDSGHLIIMPVASDQGLKSAKEMLERNQERFGTVEINPFSPTDPSTLPADSADRVLTFRNVHNLLMRGDAVAAKAFADWYEALKPGGILGVVDHHLPDDMDSALEKKSGYIKKSTVVYLATATGFEFAGESDVNANPKDQHDWPDGVWTLPPTYKLGDVDRDKYQAIGESDRMTLKFVKPEE